MLSLSERFNSLIIKVGFGILSLRSRRIVKIVKYLERGVSMKKHKLAKEALAESMLDRRICSWMEHIKAILDSCGMWDEWNRGVITLGERKGCQNKYILF